MDQTQPGDRALSTERVGEIFIENRHSLSSWLIEKWFCRTVLNSSQAIPSALPEIIEFACKFDGVSATKQLYRFSKKIL